MSFEIKEGVRKSEELRSTDLKMKTTFDAMRDTSYKQTLTPAQLMTIHYHEARTVQDLKQNDDGPRTQ